MQRLASEKAHWAHRVEEHGGRGGQTPFHQRIGDAFQEFEVFRAQRRRRRLRGEGMFQALVQLTPSGGEMIHGQGAHRTDQTSGTEDDALYGAAAEESICAPRAHDEPRQPATYTARHPFKETP